MALRICRAILQKSLRFTPNHNLSASFENASLCLRTDCSILRPWSVFCFTPACYIASDAFLERLLKGKATDTDESPFNYPASVPPDRVQQMSMLLRDPDQPANSKTLKVVIIGAPNAGKSTLTNQLLGRKLFAVSKKVHTTRSRAFGVLTEDATQIVLLDTPGLTTPTKVKRHELEKSLLVDPWVSLQEADLVVVLVDCSDKWTRNRLDFEVLKCLTLHRNIPAVLVLNKVDALKNKTMLLDITSVLTEGIVNGKKLRMGGKRSARAAPEQTHEEQSGPPREPDTHALTAPGPSAEGQDQKGLSREAVKALKSRCGWPHFKDVFMLSALDEEDVGTLKTYLLVNAKPGSWEYHSEVLTDQTPEDICLNTVREKLLEYLPQEVPYTMTQSVELWRETEQGSLDINVKLFVKKDSHMKMVIGQGGQMISKIAREAGEDLRNVFLQEVRLKISAKVRN